MPRDPLPKRNPLEPQFMELLRSFATGKEFTRSETKLAAHSYLELLRAYLLGTRDTVRSAMVVAPAAVRAFFSQLPRPDFDRTEEIVLGYAPAAVKVSAPLVNLLSRDTQESHFLAQTAEEVSATFRQNGIAFAHASSAKMTRHVQELIGNLMAAGTPNIEARDIIAAATGWTKGYAETAYRTTAMASYVGGRIDTQSKPFISSIMLGFEVIGSDDSDTRRGRPEDKGEHHLAALGLVAETTDPVWQVTTPPYGFNCRHMLRSISRMEARRKGWLKEGRLQKQVPPTFSQYSPKRGFGIKPVFRP